MKALRSVLDLLASWKLSVVLMVQGALFYGLLVIWSTSSPPHVIGLIAQMLPFRILYVLLLINTALCLWRRIPALVAGISPRPLLTQGPARWEAPIPAGGIREASRLLCRMGYRAREEGEGLWGLRRRWTALGTFLFHGAFFLVALGFLVSSLGHRELKTWVAVGERYEGRPDQILSVSPDEPGRSLPSIPKFEVAEIHPSFWQDILLFTELRARLLFPGGRERVTRINRPLWVGPGTFLRLSGLGYALAYEVKGPDGRTLDAAVVRMNVFPPGQRDLLVPAGLPHRIYVQVIPDQDDHAEGAVTRSLNLTNPRIAARVYRGRVDLGSALLKPGEALTFEGISLSFDEIRYWGEFTVVQDAGAPVVFLGFALGLVGLALKLRGPRCEITWMPSPDGGGILRGWGGADGPPGGKP